ncbi:MAG: hypothetical protein KatS3mg027_0568 [Bacteroidia bacterium]|nr:MAG: hypothetical protein KatS3mg027_0568 [Bacteroidia bacterium]
MFPGVENWKWNRLFFLVITLFFFRSSIICRGVFAFHIAYPFRKMGFIKKIIFDARGAYKAEFHEYKVIDHLSILNEIEFLEKTAVQHADFRMAVSNALVNYWKQNLMIKDISNNYVVIPCTLSNDFVKPFPNPDFINQLKKKLGFNEEDVILIFSGSSAGWQSTNTMNILFDKLLKENDYLKIIFLGNHQIEKYDFYKPYADRITQKNVEPHEVLNYLYIGDYGWLVREESVTNQVASPVKFAEYLSAGLKVLISPNLGDYSKFCIQHQCGEIIDLNKPQLITLRKINYEEKKRLHQLAEKFFRKECYQKEYQKIIEFD